MVTAIVSSSVGFACTYDVLRFERRYQYVLGGYYLDGWDKKRSPYAQRKFHAAVVVFSLTVLATICFLGNFYGTIAPAQGDKATPKGKMPCGGLCEASDQLKNNCTKLNAKGLATAVDPNCRDWADALLKEHPFLAICPVPYDDYVGNVTFSCLADGMWNLISCFICALWVAVTWRIHRRNDGESEGAY